MMWSTLEPPQAGERLTRHDVKRLIEEHGGPEGLDLRQADLRQAHLIPGNAHTNLRRCGERIALDVVDE